MQNGTAIAGETSFSLSCCVTLPQGIQDEEELTIEILMPVTINDTDNSVNRINGSVIDGSCTYTSVLRFTILKTSHGGKYICIVTFNSSTIASTTTTVNIQSKFYNLSCCRLATLHSPEAHEPPISSCIHSLIKSRAQNQSVLKYAFR